MRLSCFVLFTIALAGCGGSLNSPGTSGALVPTGRTLAQGGAVRPSVQANALLVATYYNSGTGGVAEFTETGNLLSITFPNVNNPVRIAYDAHNRFIYVLNFAAGTNSFVTAYDAHGVQQSLAGGFPGIASPTGILYDPHNGLIYISNTPPNKSQTVSAFDEAGNPQHLTGYFGSAGAEADITFDPGNNFIYMADGKNILAYNEQGIKQKLAGAFLNAQTPSSLTYDPHNGSIYATQSVKNGTVVVYDQQGHLQRLTPGFATLNPVGVAYDKDNNFIYVAAGTPNQPGGKLRAYDESGNPQTLSGRFDGFAIGDVAVVR